MSRPVQDLSNEHVGERSIGAHGFFRSTFVVQYDVGSLVTIIDVLILILTWGIGAL